MDKSFKRDAFQEELLLIFVVNCDGSWHTEVHDHKFNSLRLQCLCNIRNEKELLLIKALKKEKSSFLDEDDWELCAPGIKNDIHNKTGQFIIM